MPRELGVELLLQLNEILWQRHSGGLHLAGFQVDAVRQFVCRYSRGGPPPLFAFSPLSVYSIVGKSLP